jgi:hypothetical protein
MGVIGEEGDDGVSEGSGAERGDVRGVKTSLRWPNFPLGTRLGV